MPEIGIVLRTFNEAALLGRTLDAVMGQSEQAFEIVLVDSGSTDSTLQIARGYDRVKVIEIAKKNFTYGRALNIGIEALDKETKYIAMLSAHAIPCDKNWLGELVAPMRNDPKIAGVYGKQAPLPEHLFNPVVRVLASGAYPKCYGDEPFVTGNSYFFSNANGAILYSAWQKHKFDENLAYSEDALWAKEVIAEGGRLAYQPSAAAYHSHPDTFRQYYVRSYREAKSNREIDPRRYSLISRKKCVKSISERFFIYLRECICRKSLKGMHWNRCRVGITAALANYKGRKNAIIKQ